MVYSIIYPIEYPANWGDSDNDGINDSIEALFGGDSSDPDDFLTVFDFYENPGKCWRVNIT